MKKIDLNGYIGMEITAGSVSEALKGLNGEDITVNLHTPGGSVFEALEVYNQIKQYPGKKTLNIGGRVASAGSLLLGAFDHVVALDISAFMYHNAQGISMGDYVQLRRDADNLEKINTHIANILAARSGKKVETILDEMNKETWLYGHEIKDAGFADEIVISNVKQDKDTALIQAMDEQKKISAFFYKEYFNQSKGVTMNKEQILAALRAQGITLLEAASALGVTDQIITAEHKKAMDVMTAFKELGIPDPVAEMKRLTDKVTAQEKVVRKSRLDEVFNASKELRDYAEDMLRPDEDLEKGIERIKNTETAKRLAKEAAEGKKTPIGIMEGGKNKASGVKVKEM